MARKYENTTDESTADIVLRVINDIKCDVVV